MSTVDPYRDSTGRPRKRRPKIHKARTGLIKPGRTKSDINVTPLVDVVLVLLIIFMVVTPMLHRGVHVELPQTEHHGKKQDTGEQLVVTVRNDGIWIESARFEGDELAAKLRSEMKTNSRPVHLRGDKSVKYVEVRKALEKIHAAGAQTVGLGSEDKKE